MLALIRTVLGTLVAALIGRTVVILSKFHDRFNPRTPERVVSRRAFLRNVVLGSVGVSLAGITGGFLTFFWNNKKGVFGGKVPVPMSLVPAVGAAPYRNQGGKFFIINNEEGALAIYWKCVHLGCTVPWNDAAGEFICPCHGSHYDRHGVLIKGPAPRPLDLFPITIEGNNIIVDTNPETAIVRTEFDPSQATKI